MFDFVNSFLSLPNATAQGRQTCGKTALSDFHFYLRTNARVCWTDWAHPSRLLPEGVFVTDLPSKRKVDVSRPPDA